MLHPEGRRAFPFILQVILEKQNRNTEATKEKRVRIENMVWHVGGTGSEEERCGVGAGVSFAHRWNPRL